MHTDGEIGWGGSTRRVTVVGEPAKAPADGGEGVRTSCSARPATCGGILPHGSWEVVGSGRGWWRAGVDVAVATFDACGGPLTRQ